MIKDVIISLGPGSADPPLEEVGLWDTTPELPILQLTTRCNNRWSAVRLAKLVVSVQGLATLAKSHSGTVGDFVAAKASKINRLQQLSISGHLCLIESK